MVTGACNLDCPHCSQGQWREFYSDYQMTVDEIGAVASSGHRFKVVHIAGGEPTMWREFESGCEFVKRSGLGKRIEVSSNCFDYPRIIDALRHRRIDLVYCQVSNASAEGIAAIQAVFPDRLLVGRRRKVHKPLPKEPMAGVLPATCGCDRPAVFAGRVYQCADVYPNMVRLGLNSYIPKSFADVTDDWMKEIRAMDRFNHPACAVCLANRKVWDRIP